MSNYILKLNKIPAFGYETASIQARDVYDDLASKVASKIVQIAPNLWENWTKKTSQEAQEETLRLGSRMLVNLSKVVGHLACFGSFIGVGRIVATYYMPESFSRWNYLRAVGEIFGASLIFFVVDLAVTTLRSRKLKKLSAEVLI